MQHVCINVVPQLLRLFLYRPFFCRCAFLWCFWRGTLRSFAYALSCFVLFPFFFSRCVLWQFSRMHCMLSLFILSSSISCFVPAHFIMRGSRLCWVASLCDSFPFFYIFECYILLACMYWFKFFCVEYCLDLSHILFCGVAHFACSSSELHMSGFVDFVLIALFVYNFLEVD